MRDYFVLLFFFLIGLFYLFYSTAMINAYPYFMVATFVLALSLGIFFLFLPHMTKSWFIRLIVVNIAVIVFIPIIEGMDWLGFTVLYLAIISFLFIGYSFYIRKHK
ncbi:hypothetical protein ACERII_23395 [Evansella sp. AB-rgal1]|uniref:hypothetical protein n=1 Tax=Evansella sp. AB-rgal1 TaxID=3242696 RepID=UPI00359D6325